MNKSLKLFYVFLLLFSILHLTRDIFQNYHIQNPLTGFAKVEQNWCGSYCDLITYPFEIYIFFISLLVLKRNKSDILGSTAIAIFFLWLAMFLYDYFIFNQ